MIPHKISFSLFLTEEQTVDTVLAIDLGCSQEQFYCHSDHVAALQVYAIVMYNLFGNVEVGATEPAKKAAPFASLVYGEMQSKGVAHILLLVAGDHTAHQIFDCVNSHLTPGQLLSSHDQSSQVKDIFIAQI